MKRYPIKQRTRMCTNVRRFLSIDDVVLRPSQRKHDLLRANVVDGITTSTGIFDESEAVVDDLWNPELDKFDIANKLIERGLNKQANDIAADGLQNPE